MNRLRILATRVVPVAIMLTGISNAASAGSFTADFTCKFDLGRALFASTVPAIGYAFGNGSLKVTEQPGGGNASAFFTTTFATSGDFTASVSISRANLGNALVGIAVGDVYANSLQDVFYSASDQVGSNVFALDGSGVLYSNDITDTSATAAFSISRTSNVITSGYNAGSGFVPLEVSPNVAGYGVPVRVTLFLIEAAGDTAAHQGAFTTLNISASSLGKTCKSPGL